MAEEPVLFAAGRLGLRLQEWHEQVQSRTGMLVRPHRPMLFSLLSNSHRSWFSQGTTIGCTEATGAPSNPNTKSFCNSTMKATINDPDLRTYNRAAPAGSAADIYKHNPWRYPGNAPGEWGQRWGLISRLPGSTHRVGDVLGLTKIDHSRSKFVQCSTRAEWLVADRTRKAAKLSTRRPRSQSKETTAQSSRTHPRAHCGREALSSRLASRSAPIT